MNESERKRQGQRVKETRSENCLPPQFDQTVIIHIIDPKLVKLERAIISLVLTVGFGPFQPSRLLDDGADLHKACVCMYGGESRVRVCMEKSGCVRGGEEVGAGGRMRYVK